MLSLDSVSFTIKNKTLLKDISQTLDKGKIYGIVGHNGSGKTTLIKLLAGEQDVSSGAITLEGNAIQSMPSKVLARKIAYLPQKLPDAHAFTVEELVMLGRYPWQKWLQKPSQKDKKIVTEAMQHMQILDKATQTVATLSGGERARAWLAMCLAQRTNYLLLDEPLASLDIVYQVEILKIIKQLVTTNNLGVVLIIHDINLAAQFCDEFIALKNGQICHTGSVAETMNTSTLQQIFGIRLHMLDHPSDTHKVAVV